MPNACDVLASQLGTGASGPLFLASYPTAEPGPLHDAAFLYDNAVAVVALVGCGRPDLARRIGDALLAALDRDRFWHDGRLRNGYAAGPVDAGPVKLAGWWDDAQNRWLEDRYQAGSDVGNLAWAMLALLALDRTGADPRYRTGAERIGQWVATQRDSRGDGGFTGGTFGHEPTPTLVRWKSVEHNTDLVAAFSRLAAVTNDPRWRDNAVVAQRFVEAMWDPQERAFAAGTGDDGVSRNPTLALDAQIWPLLALPGAVARFDAVLATVERRLGFQGGFAYGEPADGVWTEGTAQVAVLSRLRDDEAQAATLLATVAAQRTPDGGYYATSTASIPTGFVLATDPAKPRLYYHLPHLGALAWAALAERGFNPFTLAVVQPAR
ncbi:MAG: hypothetical protein P4M00_22250 [Azospirillaceae bacterium]|nr:hypothetical protein [Azospirillaceae bacterium]